MMQTEPASTVLIKTLPVGPLQCNCTIIGDKISGQAIVIDPGGDAEKLLQILADEGLSVRQIIHTHAHFDHFLASGHMHHSTGAPLCLHKKDQPLWENLETQCQRFNVPCQPVPDPHHWLEDEETLELDQIRGQALFTPGHTPGSMSFWFEEIKLLVAGDTLFKGGIGRTDLWGGDYPTIKHSIQTRLYTLDETATVITGHGPATTLGHEMRHNPYVTAWKSG